MPKFLIEREFPGAGDMSPEELHDVAVRSNEAHAQAGTQWVQTYVTGDHFVCVFNAESEDAVREHARLGGFPCDSVRSVGAVIDPITGEG